MSGAEAAKEQSKDQPAPGGKKKFPLVITAVVGLVMGGLGFMVPVLAPSLFGGGEKHADVDTEAEDAAAQDAKPAKADHGTKEGSGGHAAASAEKKEGGGHGAAAAGHGAAAAKEGEVSSNGHRSGMSGKPSYLKFGQMVVNLNSDRMNRYLRMTISLQVDDEDYEMVEAELDHRKLQLKSWMVAYLSDVSVDDVRGTAGQNRLRRDIQDHINTTLFEDGIDRVQDILFEEFTVQ